MGSYHTLLSVIALIWGVSLAIAEQAPVRDSTALLILQQSIQAMGGGVPVDAHATGVVTLVEGSKTQSGTIHVLTRGLDQTAEEMALAEERRALIYSREYADEIRGDEVTLLNLELVVTSPSPNFPLVLLAAALDNPEVSFQYIGSESLNGVPTHHVRFWNTFFSRPQLKHLAEFTTTDVWLDAASGLPLKLAYDRRAAGGSEGRTPVQVFYADYRRVGGLLYPFRLAKSLNGTPWANILIERVAFNTGLSDANFPVH